MQNHKYKKTQQGYALTEVLIAGVIAASVLTVTASGISTGVRAIRDTAQVETYIHEATQISNGLRAGLPIDDIAQNFPDWQWKILVRPQDGNTSFDAVHLATYQFARKTQTDRAFDFSASRLEGGNE